MSLHRLAASALVLFASLPAQALVRYLGHGDSITRGNGCFSGPPTTPFVFDEASPACTTSCSAATAEQCGYVWRLENLLAGSGISADVVNFGESGEGTAGGLTRLIQQVLPTGGDVLIVMHGTNDVSALLAGSGPSIEDIKANLGAMVDEATCAGLDAILASVIRRIDNSDLDAIGLPNEPNTIALRAAVIELATEKDRSFADPWAPLCPNQPCFNAHYFQDGGAGDPGHVDSSGYDIMAPHFHAAIAATAVPAAPAAQSPAGICDPDCFSASPVSLTYEWQEIPNATWYRFEVEGPSGTTLLDEWHAPAPKPSICPGPALACSGSLCSISPDLPLGAGAYRWRVRARTLAGSGPAGSWLDFSVYDAPPPAAAQLHPSGATFDTTPTFRWQAVGVATQYDLEVDGAPAAGSPFASSSVCSGDLCEVDPGTPLTVGPHDWRVRTQNPVGPGPLQSPLAFEVLDCSPMDLTLGAADTGTSPLFSACNSITAGGGFAVQSLESVTLHAGAVVIFQDDFEVETDAELTVKVDQ